MRTEKGSAAYEDSVSNMYLFKVSLGKDLQMHEMVFNGCLQKCVDRKLREKLPTAGLFIFRRCFTQEGDYH